MCNALSFGWLLGILIWVVVVGAIVLILRLLVPYIAANLGYEGALIAKVINIIVAAVVIVAVIYLVADLLTCATPLRFR